jgi:Fe-S cluster assembly protein SufD
MSVGTELERGPFAASFASLDARRVERPRREPGWLRALRARAKERFLSIGLPGPGDEEWRATSVAPIRSVAWHHAAATKPGRRRLETFLELERRAPVHFGPPGWARLVFLDGRHERDLSAPGILPPGVTVRSLRSSLTLDGALVASHLGRHAALDEPFVALNTALEDDGALVHVPAGVVVPEPISILHVIAAERPGIASHPRNLIVLGEGAQASVVESYVTLGSARSFTNAVTEVALGAGAVLDHTLVERGTGGTLLVTAVETALARASRFSSSVFAFGGALVRNDARVRFEAEDAECSLALLSVLRERDHVDNHTVIDHLHPRCRSRELAKAVLDGRSHGVFTGRVVVHPGAQKTDAQQSCRALLLSDDAVADARPQLRIHADDVKCAHGAAVGRLDEDAVFYLRSRGVDRATARGLLTLAFASEVTSTVRSPLLRAHLDALVSKALVSKALGP